MLTLYRVCWLCVMTMQFQKWPTKFGFDWPLCPSNNFFFFCTLFMFFEYRSCPLFVTTQSNITLHKNIARFLVAIKLHNAQQCNSAWDNQKTLLLMSSIYKFQKHAFMNIHAHTSLHSKISKTSQHCITWAVLLLLHFKCALFPTIYTTFIISGVPWTREHATS